MPSSHPHYSPTNPTTPLQLSTPPPSLRLEGERLALWHALELDELIVGAIGRQHRASVLEVLALRLALERLQRGLVEPVG